jgi:hypothetical protein
MNQEFDLPIDLCNDELQIKKRFVSEVPRRSTKKKNKEKETPKCMEKIDSDSEEISENEI